MQRKTAKDRFNRGLRDSGLWCRAHRHWRLADQQAALSRKLQGHCAYNGITGNMTALARFYYEVWRQWRKWLDRRSWHTRASWVKLSRLSERYPLPTPRVINSVFHRAAIP